MYYSFWWSDPLMWLIIGILVLLVLSSGGRGRRHRRWYDYMDDKYTKNSGNAKNILDERFAKGEITEEEYKKSVETLKAHQ